MSKFNQKTSQPSITAGLKSPVKTTGHLVVNHGGALAHGRDAKSDLFLLAVTNMVGENTFYETANQRDNRFRDLVHIVTEQDPEWMQKFIPWLRTGAFMRSASIVAAVEYVRAKGPLGHQVLLSAFGRADEPGEALAYYMATNGGKHTLAAAIKRGVALGATQFYNERNALKYDGSGAAWRFGDVIDMTFAKPKDEAQSALFNYLITKRHGRDDLTIPDSATMLRANKRLWDMPVNQRRDFLDRSDAHERLAEAGMTWESLSSWINGPLDAKVWEAIIPSMGYMALLRNLRNFDDAKIAKSVIKAVQDRLQDPEEVAKSRQFPFRFLSAYRATQSDNWKFALGEALDLSCANLPVFTGYSLVGVDTSGSMSGTLSNKGLVRMDEVGALFGIALAKKAGGSVDLIQWADRPATFTIKDTQSVLANVERFMKDNGKVGYGTNLPGFLQMYRKDHDRIAIFSDFQTLGHYSRGAVDTIPHTVPIYSWNLMGYAGSQFEVGQDNRHEFGGFSDASFRLITLLENRQHGTWPWEISEVNS